MLTSPELKIIKEWEAMWRKVLRGELTEPDKKRMSQLDKMVTKIYGAPDWEK